MKGKMKHCVFFWQVSGYNYTAFTMGKLFLFNQALLTRFTQTNFPAFSELCKDISRKQCTIPWEKRSGKSILWVLTAIPVLTLTVWNGIVSCLMKSKKWKAACFFRKLKHWWKWEGNRQEGQGSPNGGHRLQVPLKILCCHDDTWLHLNLNFSQTLS